MSKELVISANRHETRVAIVEDEQVVEIYHQRENEYSLAGSIHKGRVTRVLPGMQSAFVDIGLDRDAFLYVSDFFEDNEEYDKIVTSVEEKVLKLDKPGAVASAVVVTAASPIVEEAAAASVETVSAPPAEVENGSASVVTAPALQPAGQTGQQPERRGGGRDGGNRDGGNRDGGNRDDDRRGRRGRRRGRGGKERGGRGGGLPESKYYSPGRGGEGRREQAPEAEPVEAAEVTPVSGAEADDFFVLPGESLAKYRGPAGEEEEPLEAGEPLEASDVSDVEEIDETAETVEAAEPEAVEETVAVEEAVETAEEREPEAAVVAEPVEPEPVAVEAAPVVEEPVAEAPVAEEAPAETAEDVDAVPTDAAEPVETPEGAEDLEVAGDEAVGDEGGEAAEAAESESEGQPDGEAIEAIAEEEGPEPARIPTSLTATLREQGPRYLHRVSRRMRRKGGREGGNREPREGGNREPREGGGREPREGGGREPREGGRGPQEGRAPQQDRGGEQRTVASPRPEGRPEKVGGPSISDLLKEGQEIIVQIAKEPLGQKGARITSHIALPGRFLVYMPTVDHIGVSRKIPSDDERSRLKRILQTHRVGISGGFIVRTAGADRTEEELRADMHFLYNLWLDMRQKAERRPAPLLIHHDLNVVERVLRDQLTAQFKSIWVDNEELYESVLRFVQRFQPALVSRVKLYTRSTPIFDEFGVTAELEKALRPKVWLKSGGYIVINQTEALVAIDINTGKYVGKSNRLEDTIVKTNTDAIKEIVRQIRLRDLGGIIVVDFIDMDERKNRQKVMQALEEAMRADRAPYKILQFNDFGLVAITRKRVKQSLERTLCTPCPYCEGAGYVKSPNTVVGEILTEAQKIAKAVEGKDVMLRVAPEVAKLLKSNQNSFLQELEEILGRTVIVKSDSQLHQEKFDLA
jgi:ribonuclease G